MTKPLAVITGASAGIGRRNRPDAQRGGPSAAPDRPARRPSPGTGSPRHRMPTERRRDVEGFRAAVAEAEELHGPVDLLVNNAGWLDLSAFRDQEPEHWQGMFETNVVGLLNTTSVVFSPMLERRAGTIVNIGSTAGHRYGPNHVVYVGTKFAVRGLTEGLRAEAAGSGVRVVLISPGTGRHRSAQPVHPGGPDRGVPGQQGPSAGRAAAGRCRGRGHVRVSAAARGHCPGVDHRADGLGNLMVLRDEVTVQTNGTSRKFRPLTSYDWS